MKNKKKSFSSHKQSTIILVADINDLSLPKTCNTDFPDPDDLLAFKLIICPDEGIKLNSIFLHNSNCFAEFPSRTIKFFCFFFFNLSRFLQTRALRVQFQGKIRLSNLKLALVCNDEHNLKMTWTMSVKKIFFFPGGTKLST